MCGNAGKKMEFTRGNIESGRLNFDGEIVVKADSPEFEYLCDLYTKQ